VIALDGKDLCGSRDASGRLVLFSAMTHRVDGRTGITLGQIAVPEGTTETTQVRTLLSPIDVDGALVSGPMRPIPAPTRPATWWKTRTPTTC
jgi:hypothetical protein